jgi:hypothetical protein
MTGIRNAWPVRVNEASHLARHLLAGYPERWEHTRGVAGRAVYLARAIGGDDPSMLIAAAWLHDIGYADPLVDSGFHPLDGARYLSGSGWPSLIAALVAHHSGARFVAAAHWLSRALSAYPHEETALGDALTYADQTTGPYGRRMTVKQRMAEMLDRHGTDSPNAAAQHLREPYLLAVADRVERRLANGR